MEQQSIAEAIVDLFHNHNTNGAVVKLYCLKLEFIRCMKLSYKNDKMSEKPPHQDVMTT